ncbi:MAG: DegV family protein [Firmicutes bacterium]|nr:DegV family protein [Bacillota bacterium]
MNKIRIVTDSASEIPQHNPHGIRVLPMTIRFGDTEYRDGVDITQKEFYEKLIESDEMPVTSLVSPAQFSEAFQAAADAGETVIAITISSALSGTWQCAALAAESFPGKVFVVDSRNVTIGEEILVLRAVELVREGLGAQEIAAVLEQEKEKIHLLAVLDTLEYLKKGGRVSGTVAFVGGMLAIKPVVAVQDGTVAMIGKARGSRNGNNYLIKEIEKTAGVDFSKPIRLGYTGLTDAYLQKYIADSRQIWEGHEDALAISMVGSTVGTHVGPNAIAVAYFAK